MKANLKTFSSISEIVMPIVDSVSFIHSGRSYLAGIFSDDGGVLIGMLVGETLGVFVVVIVLAWDITGVEEGVKDSSPIGCKVGEQETKNMMHNSIEDFFISLN